MKTFSLAALAALVLASAARADEPAKKKLAFSGLDDRAATPADKRAALETALAQAFAATMTGAPDDAPELAASATLTSGDHALLLHLEARSDPKTAVATVERTVPLDDPAPAALRAANELVAKVDEAPAALVTVESTPEGAAVALDGQPFGNAPVAQTFVAPGAHKFSWHLEGRVGQTQDVTLAAGDSKELAAQLAEDPAVVAAREKAKAEAEAEARARAAAEAKREADAKAEREKLDEMERDAEAQAKARQAAEEAARKIEADRRQLFGAVVRLAGALPSSEAAAGLDALKVGAGSRIDYGLSLRSPLFWKRAWGAVDLDYWRDDYWPTDPPTGTIATARSIPVGMFSLDVAAGWRERFGDLFFADGAVSVGARRTRYARHETFQGGDPLDELSAKWAPTVGLQLRAGATYGIFEAALSWRLSAALGEKADDPVGDVPSIAGFGPVSLVGLEVGVAY